MSDERDIDDILESLDQLLRSGDHFNDDHVDSPPAAATSDKQAAKEVVAEEAPDESASDALQTAQEQSDLPLDDSDPAFDLPLDMDEADFEAESDADVQPAEPIGKQRVVLTEDMMIDNPQGKLSLRVVEESEVEVNETEQVASEEMAAAEVSEAQEESTEPVNGVAEESVAAESLHIDHAHLETLMAQVSDDVIARLQQELPRMIRESIYHHLNELRQQGDAPDADNN